MWATDKYDQQRRQMPIGQGVTQRRNGARAERSSLHQRGPTRHCAIGRLSLPIYYTPLMTWDQSTHTLHAQLLADFADVAIWRDIGRFSRRQTTGTEAAPTASQHRDNRRTERKSAPTNSLLFR